LGSSLAAEIRELPLYLVLCFFHRIVIVSIFHPMRIHNLGNSFDIQGGRSEINRQTIEKIILYVTKHVSAA